MALLSTAVNRSQGRRAGPSSQWVIPVRRAAFLVCFTSFLVGVLFPARGVAGILVTAGSGTILNPGTGTPVLLPGVSLGAGGDFIRFNLGYRFATQVDTHMFEGSIELLPISLPGQMSNMGIFAQGASGASANDNNSASFGGGGIMLSFLTGSDQTVPGTNYSQYFYGVNIKLGAMGGESNVSGFSRKFRGGFLLLEIPIFLNPAHAP